MRDLKSDFPIFKNNKELIYFDSWATGQKPTLVIDAIKDYLEQNNSNIHRWSYDISYNSEQLYIKSKQKVVEFIGGDHYSEIIYTYNANYRINLLAQTLRFNNYFKKWDKILLSPLEHHSNIVPWITLQKEIWVELVYLELDSDFNIDFDDFIKKYDSSIKLISITHVSNVIGQILDVEKIWSLKRDDTLFVVDVSQSIPHMSIDVKEINADFVVFTAHKMMADMGLWVLWGKSELLNSLEPVFSWWWAISWVQKYDYKNAMLPNKFEPWTPNISWAISLLTAIEYIDSIGWYESIDHIERELVNYTIEWFKTRPYIKLLWSTENKIGLFSFYIPWINVWDIAEILSMDGIAVRAGKHCNDILFSMLGINGSVRISLYIYNTTRDVDKFFEILDNNFSW